MDNFTKTNTTRILKFLQPFRLDFNDYSIWNYLKKKYKDEANTKPHMYEAIEFLNDMGYIEKVRRPGYFRLTEKGKYFISWDLENIEEVPVEEVKTEHKSWINRFTQNFSPTQQV